MILYKLGCFKYVMTQLILDTSPIIECNLDKIKVESHEENKDHLLHIVRDLYASNVNYNQAHHASVWCSPNGIQSIHSFANLVNGIEIATYANIMSERYKIKPNKTVAITDMWVTITPPGGQLLPKRRIKSLVTGTYFLHAPQENATINFRKPIDPHWFDKVFDPFNRTHYNSPEELVEMREGWIYFYPSYLESNNTTNLTEEERISIDFILDIVDK